MLPKSFGYKDELDLSTLLTDLNDIYILIQIYSTKT